MYIRQSKTKYKKSEYITYKLVENIRVDGSPKQINLLSLGKLETLNTLEIEQLSIRIEEIYRNTNLLFSCDNSKVEDYAQFFVKKLINKEFKQRVSQTSDSELIPAEQRYESIDINSTYTTQSEQIGGEYLCKQAIEELGLSNFFVDTLHFNENQLYQSLLALTGRLLHPSSDCETARWLNENSAALEFYPLASSKINKNQLYTISNILYENKSVIETYLNEKIRSIYNLKRKIYLFDLTNTHFEGQMKGSNKSTFGRNKQKRNDCRQITLGLLVDENGFPIQSRYYAGNVSEPRTIESILQELITSNRSLFSEDKPCVIIDAGFAVDSVIARLNSLNFEYIAVSRSKHNDLIKQVAQDKLITFKNKSDAELSAQLFKQVFTYQDEFSTIHEVEESIIYVKSADKEKKERSIDLKKCKRFEEGLIKIQQTIVNPRGKKQILDIYQRLGRLKEKNKGICKLYKIDMKDDTKNIISLTWEKIDTEMKTKNEGVYFLRSNISDSSLNSMSINANEEHQEEKLWKCYRIINEVESAFCMLKSDLDMRPNYHQNDTSIEAHINMCILGLYVATFIRHRLKSAGIHHSWSEIVRIMSTQKRTLTVQNMKDNKTLWTRTCTVPTPKVEQIYKCMGYNKIPYYRKSIIK